LTLPVPAAQLPPSKGIAFVVQQNLPNRESRLAELQQLYPGGSLVPLRNARGETFFTAYLVSRAQLEQSRSGTSAP
jgi:hypothetical protein